MQPNQGGEPMPTDGTDAKPGKKLCGAKNKPGAKNKYCQSDKLGPAGRCRMHNGWAVGGPMHPNFKHGKHVGKHRWLASLPKVSLGDRFDAAMADPALASLRAAIALNDAMLTSYTSQLHDTGRPLTVHQTKRVHDLLDMQRKLAGDEARRLRDLQTMVTAEQFRLFAGVCTALFIEFVPDLKARAEIHRRLQQAMLTAGQADTLDAEGRAE